MKTNVTVHLFCAAVVLIITAGCLSSAVTSKETRAAPTIIKEHVSVSFYYDGNLNNKRDQSEPLLTNLSIDTYPKCIINSDSSISIEKNVIYKLWISGTAPNGKPLINTTVQEPKSTLLLKNGFDYAAKGASLIGLADGYFTSPLDPVKMSNLYELWYLNSNLADRERSYFFPYNAQEYNYYRYGYNTAAIKTDFIHYAFDFRADEGTEIRAAVGGIIVEGIKDAFQFGITGNFGTAFYNELIPLVTVGQRVNRYDVIGKVALNDTGPQAFHLCLRPAAEDILKVFPGVHDGVMLTSPFRGERVYKLPYFN